jgi:hypothetical protein
MGLILLLFVLPVCVVAVVRRRRGHVSFIVPLVLAVYSLVSAGWTLVGLIHAFAGIAAVDPSMKATLLAKGISELMNSTAFWGILHIPLLGGAYLADRKLRNQSVAEMG